jgi:hypothetical protein
MMGLTPCNNSSGKTDQRTFIYAAWPFSSKSHRSESTKHYIISHVSPPRCRATLTNSFPRGFHCISHTHSHTTDFLALQTSTSVGNTSALLLPSPHCDAASQTPTLPIKETTETPPPPAVKLHTHNLRTLYHIHPACYIYCFPQSFALARCLHLQTTRTAELTTDTGHFLIGLHCLC